MTDIFSKQKRSLIMQSIKSYKTSFEKNITSSLWKNGFRFRINMKNLIGVPDISIKKYKIVIFLDSCFWHGCNLHCRIPASNKNYWETKIKKNKYRDKEVTKYYKNSNWNILRIWEHELKNDYNGTIYRIIVFINSIKQVF